MRDFRFVMKYTKRILTNGYRILSLPYSKKSNDARLTPKVIWGKGYTAITQLLWINRNGANSQQVILEEKTYSDIWCLILLDQ